ncbi:hypothetical protein BWK60_01955 [Flavobacterium covae]|uniref:hypothetical protein n=1 Tax=Flavobacterium covae TaxID=2906076 RepID=UPI000B4D1639|nr:hypothetical protein [Flavobacterium covae]OWP87777.1 hypothetical protein BWK60_01955 [Flavobacterium covae]
MDIENYIAKVKELIGEMPSITEQAITKNKAKFIRLNTAQIDQFQGVDGSILKSTNSKYKGHYSLATALLASNQNPLLPKVAGEPYNFVYHGDFINNLQIEISPKKDKFEIFSTGTGSGDKKTFFDSFPSLLGLNNDNSEQANNIILEEIQAYIKTKL